MRCRAHGLVPGGGRPQPALRLLLLSALSLGACSRDLELDAQRFRCQRNSDCIRGTVCDPIERVCAAPVAEPDGGTVDAAAPPADAGLPDAGSLVDAGARRITWGTETGTAAAWWWYADLDGPALDRALLEHNARLIDLELGSSRGAWRYAAVMVENVGPAAVSTRWVGQVQRSGFSPLAGMRLIDVELAVTGTITYFAAVAVDNSGSYRSGWWWWWGTEDPASVDARMAAHNARLLDLDRYEDRGPKLAMIMVPTGAARTAWFEHQTPDDLLALTDAGLGFTGLEIEPSLDRLTVVTATCPCVRGELVFDLAEAELRAQTARDHTRIERLVRYDKDGRTVFAAILIDNGGR